MIAKGPITRAPVNWHKNGFAKREEALELLVEEPLEIRLDGAPYSVTMRTPGDDFDLVRGILFTEGIVSGIGGIADISRCEEEGELPENVINVTLRAEPGVAAPPRRERAYESRSSCGVCGTQMLSQLEQEIVPLDGGPQVTIDQLWHMQSRMQPAQPLFQATRGAHAAALFSPDGALRALREDVGRHNALDKLIGHCLSEAVDPAGDVLVLSSRASFELVQKAARARISIIATVSTTTSLARELADRLGCTLIGVLREAELMIHTHPRRILQSDAPPDSDASAGPGEVGSAGA